ncbi:MAG: tetratricopeptide repeat protein [Actinomycetota bacterium]|nr:tetratricopeptide repeat protein [Actinomycetota bacterium]
MINVHPGRSGLLLSAQVTAALDDGEAAQAAALAGEAAAAFLREQGEPSFDAPNMLRTEAQAHLDLGDYGAATVTLDRAQALTEPLPPGEPFDRLRVHLGRMRGEALLASGDRPGARKALEAALELCQATLGSEDVDAAVLHNGLGIVGKFSGAFDEAAQHYERAAEIFRLVGTSDRVLGALHHNLGGLAHSRGDLTTAERETRRALELHTASDGPAHPDTTADRGQLGGILSELGRHEEAERELRRTAVDMTAAHGPNHLEVAIARTSLGAALHRAGRLAEADAAYREGLAARERTQGAAHPELAPTLLNLSSLSEQLGDRDGAVHLAHRAATNLTGAVTDDHPVLLATRQRLAELDSPAR